MCQKILVPLDGSDVAEQALPLARHLAQRTGAALCLTHVHVMYLFKQQCCARVPYNPQFDAQCRRLEQSYLDTVAQRLATHSVVPITTSVVQAMPAAEGILQEIQRHQADLVVMATQQHGWFASLVGSTDEHIFQQAPVPVVLVPACKRLSSESSEANARHLLIPLDGSALAEEVLASAMDFGGDSQTIFTLVRVVQAAAMDDGRTQLVNPHQPAWEPSWTEARDYLESVAERLRLRGIHVRAHVVGGRPADEILKEAGRVRADLIALATHAYGGFKHLLRGSVAKHLQRNSTIPLMVQRSLPVGRRVTSHVLSKTG